MPRLRDHLVGPGSFYLYGVRGGAQVVGVSGGASRGPRAAYRRPGRFPGRQHTAGVQDRGGGHRAHRAPPPLRGALLPARSPSVAQRVRVGGPQRAVAGHHDAVPLSPAPDPALPAPDRPRFGPGHLRVQMEPAVQRVQRPVQAHDRGADARPRPRRCVGIGIRAGAVLSPRRHRRVRPMSDLRRKGDRCRITRT